MDTDQTAPTPSAGQVREFLPLCIGDGHAAMLCATAEAARTARDDAEAAARRGEVRSSAVDRAHRVLLDAQMDVADYFGHVLHGMPGRVQRAAGHRAGTS